MRRLGYVLFVAAMLSPCVAGLCAKVTGRVMPDGKVVIYSVLNWVQGERRHWVFDSVVMRSVEKGDHEELEGFLLNAYVKREKVLYQGYISSSSQRIRMDDLAVSSWQFSTTTYTPPPPQIIEMQILRSEKLWEELHRTNSWNIRYYKYLYDNIVFPDSLIRKYGRDGYWSVNMSIRFKVEPLPLPQMDLPEGLCVDYFPFGKITEITGIVWDHYIKNFDNAVKILFEHVLAVFRDMAAYADADEGRFEGWFKPTYFILPIRFLIYEGDFD